MNDLSRNYINGQWVDWNGDTLDVHEAGTGEVIARVPSSGREEMEQAIAAADRAFENWSESTLEQRIKVLEQLHAGLKERSGEIAETICREVGMPIKLATAIQAGMPATMTKSYLKLLQDFPFTEQYGNSEVQYAPVGVVGCITPWNYPLHQVILKIVPAIAAGCTIVLKPSEIAPQSAYILAEILDGTDLPKGVFNLVSGLGQTVGDTLIKHPDVRMVSFTGSTRTGNLIAHAAADDFKRIALEMGGKSASVVLPDADLGAAVKGTVNNCLLNSGQTCTALTRLLVPADQHDEACELAAAAVAKMTPGNPLEETTRLGPLASAQQRDRVFDYIRLGIEEGATLVAGGPEAPDGCDQGYFVKATVFGNVKPDSRIAQEEIFGPVLSIIPYSDEAEAIRIANGTEYGLSGAVWSADQDKAKKVASKLRTGQVTVNGGAFNPQAPFGGFGHSGIGREFGKWGLEEFLEVRSLQL
ncbi:aldehyde dehydrogenase family protein [Marinobacter sp. F4206]|uniref:aldehyde dehydrogenase family protein n=1 Tax=Marinobacter sp. F4206 TaxID=2861777 RepID=UPI001C5E9C2B|nr:aldehyde dehydrogenase family protein [Marinobacter sp. F4206]MBW4935274.1 aldehyde dehydrogenase family protein [Marinobacter sp. F4206]